MDFEKDQRNYPRADNKLEVYYSTDAKKEKSQTISKDISATGISFLVKEDFFPGDLLYLELILPHGAKSIQTKAIIIRNWIENEDKLVSLQYFDINYHDFITLLDYSLAFQIEI